jgi:hypothetical protein
MSELRGQEPDIQIYQPLNGERGDVDNETLQRLHDNIFTPEDIDKALISAGYQVTEAGNTTIPSRDSIEDAVQPAATTNMGLFIVDLDASQDGEVKFVSPERFYSEPNTLGQMAVGLIYPKAKEYSGRDDYQADAEAGERNSLLMCNAIKQTFDYFPPTIALFSQADANYDSTSRVRAGLDRYPEDHKVYAALGDKNMFIQFLLGGISKVVGLDIRLSQNLNECIRKIKSEM